MKRFGILILLFLIVSLKDAHAQQKITICNDTLKHPEGTVRVFQSPEIAQDIKPAIPTGNEPMMPGYRIQVFAGSDRNTAQTIKNDIITNFNVPVYLVYEAPYFKVRVGDFRTRLEAQKTFHDLKKTYTGILLVPGFVNWPDLKH